MRKLLVWLILLAIALVICVGSSGNEITKDEAVVAVVVVPFMNQAEAKDIDWLGYMLADGLNTKLSNLSEVSFVETMSCLFVMNQLALEPKSFADGRITAEFGRKNRAKYVITGSLNKVDDHLIISASKVDVDTSVVNEVITVKGKFVDVYKLLAELAVGVSKSLCKPTEEEITFISKTGGPSIEFVEYYSNGLKAFAEQDYKKAIDQFDKAILLREDYAKAYLCRGIVFQMDKQYESAIADYSKAIELDPEAGIVYNNRGTIYIVKGEYDKAISDFNNAIDLNPKDASTYKNRGYTYYETRYYNSAITDFSKAIELSPNDAEPYCFRGFVYCDIGSIEIGIKDLERALDLDPDGVISKLAKDRLKVLNDGDGD